MAINIRKKLAPDPATGNGTPTTTHHDEIAAQVIALLRQAVALIPYMESPHPATQRFVRAQQSVPLSFIETVTSSVDLSTELQGQKYNTAAAKDMLQHRAAFRPVYLLLTSIKRDLKFTLDSQLAGVAADALQLYEIAKGVARASDSADAMGRVLDMGNALGRKRPKARVKKADPANPGTTTTPGPTTPNPTPTQPNPTAPPPAHLAALQKEVTMEQA